MNLPRLVTLLFLSASVVGTSRGEGNPELSTLTLTVDGVPRSALVYAPPSSTPGKPLPLVFVFHGHGGGSRGAANTFEIDRRWSGAISVYPQGLPTPGLVSDTDGKLPGWQSAPGGQDDRDLRFFDALLARLKQDHPVDPARVYCAGHSNGAGFTYLLWRARPEVFAAVAPCSGAARYVAELTSKPAIILGGREDRTVKFEWQQAMIEAVKKINGCEVAGVPWEGVAGTFYPSKGGTPLVTFLYDGGHSMAPGESEWIVKFFREHPGTGAKAGLAP